MSNLLDTYNKILPLLHSLESADNYLNQIRVPKLSDKELIALNLSAGFLGIDSENHLFQLLPSELEGRIERSVYNRRRRRLAVKIEQFRGTLSNRIIPNEQYHIVDSMPLPICQFSRARRSRICRQFAECAPDYGHCAAQKMTYFGYKLHAVCTVQGVFKGFDISPASTHDIHYLNDVKTQFSQCVLIGDRGYISRQYQDDLFEDNGITLAVPKRRNQIDYAPYPPVLRKARKRIETLFSQLCDQFLVKRNYAKSFEGLATRVLSKLTALTLVQWINQDQGNNINNLKISIA
ncbi:MAG: IS982 family transposase [Gammaproteobacteria bacterium]|nr:IS982 family transposase [Gammaproteobacteria bacterium]